MLRFVVVDGVDVGLLFTLRFIILGCFWVFGCTLLWCLKLIALFCDCL